MISKLGLIPGVGCNRELVMKKEQIFSQLLPLLQIVVVKDT